MSYDEIMCGSYEEDLFHDTYHEPTLKLLKDIAARYVFNARTIIAPEVSAKTIIYTLLDLLIPAVIKVDDASAQTIAERKILSIVSNNYKTDYEESVKKESISEESEILYRKILIATDYISGMTDNYAKDMYGIVMGIS